MEEKGVREEEGLLNANANNSRSRSRRRMRRRRRRKVYSGANAVNEDSKRDRAPQV